MSEEQDASARPVVVRPNQCTRRLDCRLTDDEIDAKLLELAQATRALSEENIRLAGFQESLKQQKAVVADVEGERSRLSIVITDRREMRSVECDELLDFSTSRVFTRRDDTGELVGVRNMRDDELQMDISDIDTELEQHSMSLDELESAVRTFYRAHPEEKPELVLDLSDEVEKEEPEEEDDV